jgi:hypothetical protein
MWDIRDVSTIKLDSCMGICMSLGLRITFFVQQRWDVLSWDKLPLRNEPIGLTVNNRLRKELNLENWGLK